MTGQVRYELVKQQSQESADYSKCSLAYAAPTLRPICFASTFFFIGMIAEGPRTREQTNDDEE
jgi:hypothetical protein